MGPIQRPAPSTLRKELFSSRADGLLTALLITGLAAAGWRLIHWALTQAHWAVIQANSTLFAVGRYPIEQQWRLWLLVGLLAAATGMSWGVLRGLPRRGRPITAPWPRNDRIPAVVLLLLAGWMPAALGLGVAIQARWWALTGLLLLLRWLAGRFAGRLGKGVTLALPLFWPMLYLG